jgi:site-specific DNA-methyltransferase (adenine-specific)
MSDIVELLHGDAIEMMQRIPDGSIDLILCDPPYGTTNCAWDSIIPLDAMWAELLRIGSPLATFVFTASQPFTSLLGASNIAMLKYSWVWEKNRPTGHVHAKNKPMKKHEDILVFSRGTTVHESQSTQRMVYNPQGLTLLPKPMIRRVNIVGDDTVLSFRKSHTDTIRVVEGFPHSILSYDTPSKTERVHPTQKPVELFEYLVKTYSNPDDVVLDFTMGSGTTGIACVNTDRNFIGIEKNDEYFQIASDRIRDLLEKPNNSSPTP